MDKECRQRLLQAFGDLTSTPHVSDFETAFIHLVHEMCPSSHIAADLDMQLAIEQAIAAIRRRQQARIRRYLSGSSGPNLHWLG